MSAEPTATAHPSKRTRFRFKRPRSRSRSPSIDPSKTPGHHHHHHHHHRRHHHHHSTSTSPQPLDPDTAFRESLFDALADDEGAAFWEGVYGQPIHTYSPYIKTAGRDGEAEPLDRISDEEYTAYVRAKMWEKSNGYVAEERARRVEERRREREEEREGRRKRREEWGRVWEERGAAWEERGRRRGVPGVDTGAGEGKREIWAASWNRYLRGWEALRGQADSHATQPAADVPLVAGSDSANLGKKYHKLKIPWPVQSSRLEDVAAEAVEDFLRHGAGGELLATLKVERVRWHPDKVQQRFGRLGVDEEILRGVTGVFQIIDRLWGVEKEKEKGALVG